MVVSLAVRAQAVELEQVVADLKRGFGFDPLNKIINIVRSGKFVSLITVLTNDVMVMTRGTDHIAGIALRIVDDRDQFELSQKLKCAVDAHQPQVAALLLQLTMDLLGSQRGRGVFEQAHDLNARLRDAIPMAGESFFPVHCCLIDNYYQ